MLASCLRLARPFSGSLRLFLPPLPFPLGFLLGLRPPCPAAPCLPPASGLAFFFPPTRERYDRSRWLPPHSPAFSLYCVLLPHPFPLFCCNACCHALLASSFVSSTLPSFSQPFLPLSILLAIPRAFLTALPASCVRLALLLLFVASAPPPPSLLLAFVDPRFFSFALLPLYFLYVAPHQFSLIVVGVGWHPLLSPPLYSFSALLSFVVASPFPRPPSRTYSYAGSVRLTFEASPVVAALSASSWSVTVSIIRPFAGFARPIQSLLRGFRSSGCPTRFPALPPLALHSRSASLSPVLTWPSFRTRVRSALLRFPLVFAHAALLPALLRRRFFSFPLWPPGFRPSPCRPAIS